MADVINSLIRHLRADSTIYGLCGGVETVNTKPRVDHDINPEPGGNDGKVYPAIAVVEQPGREAKGQVAFDTPVAIWIVATKRSEIATLRARLQALFQDKWHYTLASGSADELLCIRSLSSSGEAIDREAEDGVWHVREMFFFLTPN